MIAVLLISVSGCQRDEAAPVDPLPRGSSTHAIDAGGLTREFRLYLPPTLTQTSPVPLVVMLHGGFGSADQAEQTYQWNGEADRHGFVVAYPDGLNHAWSVGDGCCGEPGRRGTDDVAFITAVVTSVSGMLPIDPERVYATGISNGAMMSYRLARESTTFGAIAPVAGTLLGTCRDPKPTSVLRIHGLADESVPFDGSPGHGPAKIDGLDISSAVDIWRTVDQCAPASVETAGVVTTSRAACAERRAVVLITVAGAGHQWPGGPDRTRVQRALGLDPPSHALDATDSIWQFFAAHPRP